VNISISEDGTGEWLDLRNALFCVIRQRVMVIYYRRFGTTYRSLFLWSRIWDR